MASTCCSVVDDEMGSAGLTGRDGQGGLVWRPPKNGSIHQTKGYSHQTSRIFSPYYDTIGGMLFDDAVDGGRVRLDGFLAPLSRPVTRMVLEGFPATPMVPAAQQRIINNHDMGLSVVVLLRHFPKVEPRHWFSPHRARQQTVCSGLVHLGRSSASAIEMLLVNPTQGMVRPILRMWGEQPSDDPRDGVVGKRTRPRGVMSLPEAINRGSLSWKP